MQSIDGKITKWEDVQDVSTWASPEDQELFLSMIAKHKVLIMGRKSYEAVKDKLLAPPRGQGSARREDIRIRIVMTRHSEEYKENEIEGKLEFTKETPQELVTRLKKEGHTEILLVGGSAIYTSFLKAGLVTDLYITVEPRIFGKGKMLVSDEELDVILNLEEVKKINNAGTLLLHYKVVYKTNSLM